MYGLAIKLWNSQFDEKLDLFKIEDDVVFLWNEITSSDILYLSNAINHLVGDDSIDSLVKEHVSLIKGRVGHKILKGWNPISLNHKPY